MSSPVTDSPTWVAFVVALDEWKRVNPGAKAGAVFMNGDTGDDLLREPKIREFFGFSTAINRRDFLVRVFKSMECDLFIDGRMKRGEFRFV